MQMVNEQKRVSVNNLCEVFNTSTVTIRRDLQTLEKKGYLKRVHGGAIRHRSLFPGLSLSEKEKINIEEKDRIAQYAAKLVNRGEVIIIDSGSTTMQFARHIKNFNNITVITNAINIVSELLNGDIEIILTGGELDKESLTLIGPLTEEILQNVAADKLFQGVDGIDFNIGLTTPNIQEAKISRIMMKAAGENILLADSSKIGRRSLGVINKIEALDKIITDSGIDKDDVKRLEDMGVKVIVV